MHFDGRCEAGVEFLSVGGSGGYSFWGPYPSPEGGMLVGFPWGGDFVSQGAGAYSEFSAAVLDEDLPRGEWFHSLDDTLLLGLAIRFSLWLGLGLGEVLQFGSGMHARNMGISAKQSSSFA